MTDLLKLAGQKGERLVKEADEISDLINNADSFFRGIDRYRSELAGELDDIDDFLSSASIVIQILHKKKLNNIEEMKKLEQFVETGATILKEYQEYLNDSEYENPVKSGNGDNVREIRKEHDSNLATEQLRWLRFALHKGGGDKEE